MRGDLVLVTGASGFIATHVTRELLRAGYKVRGTVRNLDNERKVKPLRALCTGSAQQLELIEADLLQPESWAAAVEGCRYVLHVASPFPLGNPVREDEVIKPAVEGTLNVLKAVKQAECVERVVLTSSTAAVAGNAFLEQDTQYTEDDWTDISHPKTMSYTKSKTLAERAAWDFVNAMTEDTGRFELSVVNPSYVMGPVLCGAYATSMEVTKRLMLRETPMVPNLHLRIIDVRDVAKAHLAAMVTPEAAGKRHVLLAESLWFKDIAAILASEFKSQGYRVPTTEAPQSLLRFLSLFNSPLKQLVPALGKVHRFDTSRMSSVLRVEPRPVKDTVIDMAYSMIENGIIPKTRGYKGLPLSHT